MFSKVADLQTYDDVNNRVSSSSELHQNMINLIIIFSYKSFFFRPMKIDILKFFEKYLQTLNCNV